MENDMPGRQLPKARREMPDKFHTSAEDARAVTVIGVDGKRRRLNETPNDRRA
jgi:hypothetical protein